MDNQVNPNGNGTNFFNNPVPANNQENPLGNLMNNDTAPVEPVNNQQAVVLGKIEEAKENNAAGVVLGDTSNVTYEDTLDKPVESENDFSNANNQFINTNNYSETALNDLNVDGTYNKLNSDYYQPKDYVNDPAVRENMNPKKKNTVVISQELKMIFLIAMGLLLFIFVMPVISDFIRGIIYR